MKLNFSKKTAEKKVNRLKKKIRIRKIVHGTSERLRLCVFKSAKHIYVQLINDLTHETVLSVSSLNGDFKGDGKTIAKEVGKKAAEAAVKKGFKTVVFDRNGFLYHGRIQSLAEGAREAGLQF